MPKCAPANAPHSDAALVFVARAVAQLSRASWKFFAKKKLVGALAEMRKKLECAGLLK